MQLSCHGDFLSSPGRDGYPKSAPLVACPMARFNIVVHHGQDNIERHVRGSGTWFRMNICHCDQSTVDWGNSVVCGDQFSACGGIFCWCIRSPPLSSLRILFCWDRYCCGWWFWYVCMSLSDWTAPFCYLIWKEHLLFNSLCLWSHSWMKLTGVCERICLIIMTGFLGILQLFISFDVVKSLRQRSANCEEDNVGGRCTA